MIIPTSNHQSPNLKQSHHPKISKRLRFYGFEHCLVIGYWLLVVPLFISACVLVITGVASAVNLTVSLRVGLSSFTVSGYTSPLAMVTVKQNGVIAGTTTADAGGSFSKTIQALEPDTYTFHIFSTDSEGKLGNAVEYVVAIGENQNLSLDNLLLPPTLTLDTLDTSVGEDIHLRGESYPGTLIRLFFADALMATYTADTNGRWYGLISTTNRLSGEYHVYAHASHTAGYQSIPSIGYILTLRPRGAPSALPSASPTASPSQDQATDLTVVTAPSLATTSAKSAPQATPLAEGNMIRMILVDSDNTLILWLLLLILLLLLIWLFMLLKRRRRQHKD